jgi:hypothetical protein
LENKMTTRSYADGDEISSRPAVGSAWDAVKGELTMVALYTAAAGYYGTVAVWGTRADHPLVAVVGGLGVTAGLSGILSACRAARTAGILKSIPAPTLGSAWDAVKSELTWAAMYGAVTALNVAVAVFNGTAATGHAPIKWRVHHPLLSLMLLGLVYTYFGGRSVSAAVRAVKILKKIPAPSLKPR